MSSFFEIPAQLAVLLALAASGTGDGPTSPSVRDSLAPLAGREEMTSVEPPSGPLRFGERAWLRALHENPDVVADDGFAGRVFVTSSGRYYVPTVLERRAVLAARDDPILAERVARAAAERNAHRLAHAFGRRPVPADLYLAHALGPEAAIAVIRAVAERPGDRVAKAFPTLSAGLPELGGATLTVGQLYGRVVSAVGEPPRLVAIGMQSGTGPRAEEDRDGVSAWQARVSTAPLEPASRPQ